MKLEMKGFGMIAKAIQDGGTAGFTQEEKAQLKAQLESFKTSNILPEEVKQNILATVK
jgi:hypothetical protein